MKRIFIIAVVIILCESPVLKLYASGNRGITQASPAQTVIRFYKWYTKNKKALDKIDPIDSKPGDSTVFYKLNPKKLNVYLEGFRKSGFISSIFMSDIRQVYESADVWLKAYPKTDGIIEGMEYDYIYKTLKKMMLQSTLMK